MLVTARETKMPCGRTSRTASRNTNRMAAPVPGILSPKTLSEPSCSTQPTTRPPATAPGMLRIPASTAAMNPGSSAANAPKLRKAAVNVVIGPVRIPARAPSAAAMPQVNMETRRTLTPISSEATGSCWAAWIASPEGDLKNSASATATTARTPSVISDCVVTGAPHGVT